MFCPRCGGNTLARLGVTYNAKGKAHYHYAKERKFRKQGTQFALPKPKGGRDGDLLLREDQLQMGVWRLRANKKDKIDTFMSAVGGTRPW